MVKADAAVTADLLHEIGQRLALQGGNPHRARAYSRAGESLLRWGVEMARKGAVPKSRVLNAIPPS